MPGRLISRSWQHDPTLDAPARYRRACSYEAYVPAELSSVGLRLDRVLAGLVSEAEQALRELNDEGGVALAPLARLLLRTAGVLLPLSSGQRNRWWEADGLLDLVAELEGGHPPAPIPGEGR